MPELTLAVVPSSVVGDRQAALDALCAALAQLVGRPFRGVLPASYQALATALERDQVQYAWMPPALVVLTEEQIKLRPLLTAVRHGRTDYCSALFVDAASTFDVILELEGRTVAWVDPTSASGYLSPRMQLLAQGIDPTTFFGNELFLASHAEVVRAVFDGRAQLGATYAEPPPTFDQPVEHAGFIDVAPEREARVLAWTPPIPNDVIAGHGLISNAEHRIVANALLTLSMRDDGQPLLYSAFHTEHFMPTPKDALAPLRDLVRRAREHGLLTHL